MAFARKVKSRSIAELLAEITPKEKAIVKKQMLEMLKSQPNGKV